MSHHGFRWKDWFCCFPAEHGFFLHWLHIHDFAFVCLFFPLNFHINNFFSALFPVIFYLDRVISVDAVRFNWCWRVNDSHIFQISLYFFLFGFFVFVSFRFYFVESLMACRFTKRFTHMIFTIAERFYGFQIGCSYGCQYNLAYLMRAAPNEHVIPSDYLRCGCKSAM